MDDPIFEPWSPEPSGEPGAPAAPEPEERSGSDGEAREDRRWAATRRPSAPRSPRSLRSGPALPEAEGSPSPLFDPIEEAGHHAPRANEPAGGLHRPTRGLFTDLIVPRLRALAGRLQLSGHGTMIDDRSFREIPSVRFRMQPRSGPFDDDDTGRAAVLEVVSDERAGALSARFWFDALAEEPVGELSVTTDRVDEAWVSRLLVEFVARVLEGEAASR